MTVAITSAGPVPTYTEGDDPSPIDSTLTVTDTGNLTGATVVISSGYLDGDTLTFAPQAGISASYDNGILTLSGVASASRYQALLASVAFTSTSDDPTDNDTDLTRTVTFTASDPSGPASVTHDIDVVAVDDPPTANAPASYTGLTAQPIGLKATGLSVGDVDGGDNLEQATLSVSAGTLTVTAGGSGADVTVNDPTSVTISGTIDQINALLNTDATSTVSFVDGNADSSVELQLEISDLGHTGGSTPLTASATAEISIADTPPPPPPPPPVTDPPVVAFDPTVAPYGPIVTLTGRASAAGGLQGVELFEGSLDLGAATLNRDGTWSFDYHNGAGFHSGLTAVATDDEGQQTGAAATFNLTTGVLGEGYRTVQDHFDPTSGDYTGSTFFRRYGAVYYEASYTALPSGGSAFTYSDGTYFNTQAYYAFTDSYNASGDILTHVEDNDDGSHLINAIANGQRVVSIADDTFTSDGFAERFVFRHGAGAETIAGFQVAGPGHDRVVLPISAAGRLGQILAQGYGDGQGDTTINFGRGDSITFLGVTKAELRSHPGDFSFHA